MEERNREKGSRRWFVLAGLLLAAAWFLLFQYNRFTLQIRLNDGSLVRVAYGQSYQEPGAAVYLVGSQFWKDGLLLKDAAVDISGQVQNETLGSYTLSYASRFLWWQTEAHRQVMVLDQESPVITLTADPASRWQTGYVAVDNHDGDITDRVKRVEVAGLVTYSVVDSSGNPAYLEQSVPFFDHQPPVIQLEGEEYCSIQAGSFFQDPGCTALDNADGDVTAQILVEGEINRLVPGIYPITYAVTDSSGNAAVAMRSVEVKACPRPKILWPQERTVYLTFDDGPGPYTMELLDVLDQYGVKATFFVTDSGYDMEMQEIVKRGHSIGIHTVTHDYASVYADPEAYFADLSAMRDIIYEKTGVNTTLLRFPGGSSNTVSRGSYKGLMTFLAEAVQDAGYQYFDWNVDSNDAGGARNAATVRDNVIEGIRKEWVSIVLQHDIHSFSVRAVEDIILWGLENGCAFQALTPNSPGFHHGINN